MNQNEIEIINKMNFAWIISDINLDRVLYNFRNKNLSENLFFYYCDDEKLLKILPSNTYDVSFTLSVLDHIPDPFTAIINLIRISKYNVFFLNHFWDMKGKL